MFLDRNMSKVSHARSLLLTCMSRVPKNTTPWPRGCTSLGGAAALAGPCAAAIFSFYHTIHAVPYITLLALQMQLRINVRVCVLLGVPLLDNIFSRHKSDSALNKAWPSVLTFT